MNAPTAACVLSLRRLSVTRPDGEVLLDDCALDLGSGETVLLVGPVGSGKSTLLRVLAGLTRNGRSGWTVSGELAADGGTVDLAHGSCAAGALVFQDHALFDDLTVRENLDLSISHAEHESGDAETLANSLTRGIPPDRTVSECSGGQKQLVAIARTLLSDHPVLLFDEPNAGLDVAKTARLVQTLEQVRHRSERPLLITAHHVRQLVPFVDRTILLDPGTRTLVGVENDADAVEARLRQIGNRSKAARPGDGADKRRDVAADAPRRRSRSSWSGRFFRRYMWQLCFSPEALSYMALGGLLVGFVSTWFAFRHFPEPDFLGPLFHEQLLQGIGFAQFRILVPLIAAILLSSRSSAIIAADQGHRVLSRQIDALDNLRIPKNLYLTLNIVVATLVSGLLLAGFMFSISAWVSLQTWAVLFPEESRYLWQEHFFGSIVQARSPWPEGLGWIVAKTSLSALAISTVSLLLGRSRKTSVLDLNQGIALAVVATLALVLTIHTGIAFVEF